MMLNELIATAIGEVGIAWFDFYSIGTSALGLDYFYSIFLLFFR